ncbi:MAG TPA: ABC transporter ATP-binding protein [Rectinemataceae bacterium]|nr:ABC transporter ATP-binding protein [Rectinemataceae bacterium]
MAFLELHGVVKSFGRNTVVRGLSLNVEKGEFVSLLGGSGCGKTTTLRMIAGFETPSDGQILLDGADVSRVPPNRRNLGMVFQNYALFPNMTVRRNIGFGLRIAGRHGAEVERRVDEMLELIHMEEFAQRYPHQLSGGQQQRVALARAIAIQPRALLLDEPLSALDAKIRVRLRDDIRAIQQKLGITTIYVTHDQEEALSISDRVAVMREGLIEQIGAPFEIYNRPATPYVAAFIGTQNLVGAKVLDPARGVVAVEGQTVGLGRVLDAQSGEELRLRIRPEALSLGTAGPNRLGGRVSSQKLLGSIVRLVVRVGDTELFMDGFNDPLVALPPVGEAVTLSFSPDSCTVSKPGAEPVVAVADEEEE